MSATHSTCITRCFLRSFCYVWTWKEKFLLTLPCLSVLFLLKISCLLLSSCNSHPCGAEDESSFFCLPFPHPFLYEALARHPPRKVEMLVKILTKARSLPLKSLCNHLGLWICSFLSTITSSKTLPEEALQERTSHRLTLHPDALYPRLDSAQANKHFTFTWSSW